MWKKREIKKKKLPKMENMYKQNQMYIGRVITSEKIKQI